jgi:hypothetical protein
MEKHGFLFGHRQLTAVRPVHKNRKSRMDAVRRIASKVYFHYISPFSHAAMA